VIETDRLRLRPLERTDLDWYAPFLADPDVMRYLSPVGPLGERAKAAEFLERSIHAFEADGFGHLAVICKCDAVGIGRCGLLVWETDPWTPSTRAAATRAIEVEIGWMLGAEYWGRGYATEAAVGVRDFAFAELAVPRLISVIHPDNDASIRVAEKLGMHRESTARTRFGDVLLYATSSLE
jgi:[ribosomal protein S5]-alanine N-acetyltransferase